MLRNQKNKNELTKHKNITSNYGLEGYIVFFCFHEFKTTYEEISLNG